MKNKTDPADSSLSETMAARIQIKELGDPAHQKKITDAVTALHGVIESKIERGALHVSYDPLATTEKKIEEAVRSSGKPSTLRPQIRKTRTQTCLRRSYKKLPSKMRTRRALLTPRDFFRATCPEDR